MLHRASSLIAFALLSNVALAQPSTGPAGVTPSPVEPALDPKVPPMPGPSAAEASPPAAEPSVTDASATEPSAESAEPRPAPSPTTPPATRARPSPAPAPAGVKPAPRGRPHASHRHRMRLRTAPPPPPRERAGVHRHDGFYLRLGTGFGVYEERMKSDDSDLYGGEISGDSVGLASVGEVAMGGNIRPGLVLGGGLYTARLLSSHYGADDSSAGQPPPELDPAARHLIVLGPFLDYYPRPSGGLHFQAALGLAAASTDVGNTDEDERYTAGGGGVVFGVGYEWWVGDEWSVGVLARAMAAAVTGKDDAGVRWFHGISTNPSLLFTVTYH